MKINKEKISYKQYWVGTSYIFNSDKLIKFINTKCLDIIIIIIILAICFINLIKF